VPRRARSATIERFVLGNGLRVIAAPDRSSPLVGVAVVYDVGFRSEPEGKTGSPISSSISCSRVRPTSGKVEHVRLVEAAGGVFNGHTLADLTAYYEALPVGGLDLALWLEADRMGASP